MIYSMGIDPSLTATGIVVLKDLEIIESKIITSKEKGSKRLFDISRQFKQFLYRMILRSETSGIRTLKIFIEGYSFGSRIGQAFSIGELCGVLKLAIFEMGCNFIVVQPTMLKKFITGTGKAKKELILKEVFRRWNVDLDNNNLADAYGLARLCYSFYNRKGLNSKELEIVKKLETSKNGD